MTLNVCPTGRVVPHRVSATQLASVLRILQIAAVVDNLGHIHYNLPAGEKRG
jgi:hypothetical protein